MRNPTVLALSLIAGAVLLFPDASEGAAPDQRLRPVTVRAQECYGVADADGSTPLGALGTSGGASFGSMNGGGGSGGGSGSGYAAGRAASATASPAPASVRREAPAKSVAAPPPPLRAPTSVADLASDELAAEPEAPRADRDRGPVGQDVDWGGVVHLSNDDSMSLASAQRLLYALDRGARFTLDQIRPHELLNYFTFDTTAPSGDQLFAVQASAERTGNDTLSLALAVQGASPDRAPLDLTVLVDRSGSMNAEGRMDYTRRALERMQENLVPGDRVDLVLFDHAVCTPLEGFVVGRDDPRLLRDAIAAMQPRGSTDLDLGLTEAYRVARSHDEAPQRARRVMAFTDAILNTGNINPHTVTEVGKSLDAHGIRLTGVGVGSEFRDDVLQMLTEKGKGAYVFLGSERVVDRLFSSGFDALVQTIAMDVRFALDLPPSLGMKRFYGEESSTRAEDVQPVNFQAGNSQVFLQDLSIRDGAVQRNEPIDLQITWKDPSTGAPREQRFRTTLGAALDADPHNSRKGRALMAWTDVLYAHAMGGDACGAPFQSYRGALPGLQGDAEIAYVSELIGKWCSFPTPVASWTAPAFTKVRIDADQHISDVALSCNGRTDERHLTAGESTVRFDAPAGTCNLTLHGQVPMSTRVEVPSTGVDLRCVVRGGRLACT